MKILVVGNGGREHAIVWKLKNSPKVEKIYITPANPGCIGLAENLNIQVSDNDAILQFCKAKEIDFVVIGPEVPLVNGLADILRHENIKVFGPNASAARIEGSKAFSKKLMYKFGIPTAKYKIFSDSFSAKNYLKEIGIPCVIKADGLAAGKGVIIPETIQDGLKAIDEIMEDKYFGIAGNTIVIEEFMQGEEMSVLAFTDGNIVKQMISAQDHKRALDGDQGLNTGGMGTYAPSPLMNEELYHSIQKDILEPTINALKAEGCSFSGCLYAGLMIKNNRAKVVEFNARFGDPETQVILPLLETDLLEIMLACSNGTLEDIDISWKNESAVCVVLSSGGYPGNYNIGYEITGIKQVEALHDLIFHAGTSIENNTLVTNGGRVLNLVTVEDNLRNAIDKAYKDINLIDFKDKYYRKDIGLKGLKYINN